jgi:hypothetical protein
MSLDPDLRSSLIELVLTLEELLTRPLREQHYQPDLGKVAAICHLALGQTRRALALDDEAQALEHSTPQWCPPEVLGERLRMRQRARLERAPFSPRRPRA